MAVHWGGFRFPVFSICGRPISDSWRFLRSPRLLVELFGSARSSQPRFRPKGSYFVSHPHETANVGSCSSMEFLERVPIAPKSTRSVRKRLSCFETSSRLEGHPEEPELSTVVKGEVGSIWSKAKVVILARRCMIRPATYWNRPFRGICFKKEMFAQALCLRMAYDSGRFNVSPNFSGRTGSPRAGMVGLVFQEMSRSLSLSPQCHAFGYS